MTRRMRQRTWQRTEWQRAWRGAALGSLAAVAALAWLLLRRRSRSTADAVAWESQLEQQVRRLGERERDLEQQVERLSRQENALERQVSALAEQESQLEEQVQGIGERETSMQLQIDGLERRETELEAQVANLRQRESELEGEVKQLESRESELAGEVNDLRERETRLESDVKTATAEWEQAEGRVKQHEDELQRKQSQIDHLQQRVSDLESREPAQAIHWSKRLPPGTFADLINRAREVFPTVRIPETAPQRLHELDSASERDAWLRETWRALGALHEYATSEHEFAGNFLRWSRDSGSRHVWHIDRISLQESPTTMAMHGKSRQFEIDPRIAPDGRITMQAHLKIAHHGGGHIPRIFFHDDTAGDNATGLIHIGFIGPHHLVPVASGS